MRGGGFPSMFFPRTDYACLLHVVRTTLAFPSSVAFPNVNEAILCVFVPFPFCFWDTVFLSNAAVWYV